MAGDTRSESLTPDEIDELTRRARAGDRDALEALINITAKSGSWGGRGRFTTWLHVVVVDSARSTYRRMKNRAAPSDPQATGAMERPDPRTTSVIAGTRLDLLDEMETLERDHPAFVEPLLRSQE